ncbi:MAG: Glutamine--scyllo-inositol transaminase [Candidatus Angelobacter sp.]|jgi:dTDP-4-amino-4,6-dideoxygalactose transaminase|nr:Glutamine--scyllo-inositol transaminase [Candidatus Angelobacter sp.]
MEHSTLEVTPSITAKEADINCAGIGRPSDKPHFPFLDLKAQHATIRDEIKTAVEAVLESQHFILGPEVAAFEQEIKPHVACEFVTGCASGSDALLLALMALQIGPGDEVIAPPFTFVATAGSIARLGARPVFIDIDPDTYNLDPSKLEQLITKKTKAIVCVHLFGLPAEMDTIMSVARAHKIPVIEDAAQAIGARYKGKPVGSMGAIGCFSFFPSKNLGGAGDGGLVTTNDPSLADRLRVLRTNGSRGKYQYDLLGMNSRLDSLQAAVLRVKLRYLDHWTTARQQNARLYRRLFAESGLDQFVSAPTELPDSVHVYNQFTIRTRERDKLKSHLSNTGVPTEIYYPYPLHLQPAFADLGHNPGDFPVSETASLEVLSLPIFPELTGEQMAAVLDGIADFMEVRQQHANS